MSWSIAITESSAETFQADLEHAFFAAYPDPHPGVEEQFAKALEAAGMLVAAGVVGEAPFTCTVQGYVTQDGEPSTSNSVGLSIVGTVPQADTA